MTSDMEPLFRTYPQSEQEAEIRHWLNKNRTVFNESRWSLAEIVEMALFVGFDKQAVYSVLSHGQNALDGMRFENRAALASYAFDSACKEVLKLKNKKEDFDLTNQWKEKHAYENDGTEFKEVA